MNLNEIKNHLALCESQLTHFNSRGTASSATRARAHLLAIQKASGVLRKDIMAQSKQKKVARSEAKKARKQANAKPVEEPDAVEE